MNELIPIQNCDEESCPIANNCPIGPVPNLPCAIKHKQMDAAKSYVEYVFPAIKNNEGLKMGSEVLLMPLYRQLLQLHMAEYGVRKALVKGGKISPVLKEIRETINAIQKSMKFMKTMDKERIDTLPSAKGGEQNGEITSGSYYDMLLNVGSGSISEPIDA